MNSVLTNYMLCDFFFLNRQRKKKQDHKASLKLTKNRHELYADELVGLSEYCWNAVIHV